MSKKHKSRKKKTNLGIKIGDWFEEINPDSEIKTFFKVRSIEDGEIEFIIIPLETRYSVNSVNYCSLDIDNEGWILSRFQRDGKDRLKFKKYHSEQYITFQRRDEKFVLDQLLKDLRIGFILECFGKNENNPQNPPSTQSTNKPKTAKDLGIKVGDWFEIPQIYAESKGKVRRFLRVEYVTDLEIRFQEVNIEPTNPDVDHTIEVEERPWFIKYFHKNADGTFFWETERDGRLDFERRDIDVVRKEVTSCLNLEIEDVLRHLNLLETKPEEKLKKSKYLEYVKDNEVYYLHDPKYEIKKILGQEKFCVIASGIIIINNRINYHSWNGGELNLIRLVFNNEEEFFNKVTEISEYEYHTLWHYLI